MSTVKLLSTNTQSMYIFQYDEVDTMKGIYLLSTKETPDVSSVGGKALSLIQMKQEGLPVPQGFVLTVDFFEPWTRVLQAKPVWRLIQSNESHEIKKVASELMGLCSTLEFTNEMKESISTSLQSINSSDEDLFAVRSSSPDEDLESASFAGGYETSLGVPISEIESSVRQSYASIFDERVFTYKLKQGFAIDKPQIAIIVQEQIDADSAGVAFSLNPMNNCYDELVVNANYGLGETVVSGQVTPDTFVVDKVNREIIDTKIGAKEVALHLDSAGGVSESTESDSGKACITSAQIIDLVDYICKIESFYQKPMDIEWAFSGDSLYILQARPITTYVPLTEEMQTIPGEPKRLYSDALLLEQGVQEPLSVLGTNFVDYVLIQMGSILGAGTELGVDGIAFTSGCRYYINLSNALKVLGTNAPVGPGGFKDPNVIAILETIDTKQYEPKRLPKELKSIKRKMVFKMIPMMLPVMKGIRNPKALMQTYLDEEPSHLQLMKDFAEQEISIEDLAAGLTSKLDLFTEYGIPMIMAPQRAVSSIVKMFKDEIDNLHDDILSLGMALPMNKTTQMGEALYNLAAFDDIRNCGSSDEFLAQLEQRTLSTEFLQSWDQFIEEFGFRCIREIDVATPRPSEQPTVLFDQLKNLSLVVEDDKDSKTIFEEARMQRAAAYQKLLKIATQKGRRKAKQFETYYQTIYTLGGYRENPKQYIIWTVSLFRKRVLQIAQAFVEDGRLDKVEQIFDLKMKEIDEALASPSLDLRSIAQNNTAFLRKLRKSGPFPPVIDSRGRAYFPPRKETSEGDLLGESISPGIVRGRVKILHHADEKQILPGEILVTRATDPGWTPLFINAAGIILEIGGPLQHGAIVAREYGLPCVSGIADVTERLKDGQLVEIDGSSGIIRILE